MNILICSEFFYPSVGGAQKVAFELSTNLKKWDIKYMWPHQE